jgi:hypothetical protein
MKRSNRQPSFAFLHLLVTAGAVLWGSQGCKGNLSIGHDDAGSGGTSGGGTGGSAGVGGSGTGGDGGSAGVGGSGTGGDGGSAGVGGSSTGGSAGVGGTGGSAGTGGSGADGPKHQCIDPGFNDAVACGMACKIDGVNSTFVCNDEGKCVEGPIVCGSGTCAGKACGENCGEGTCDAQGRCVTDAVDCGLPSAMCAGLGCGVQVVDYDAETGFPIVCTCDANGRCLQNATSHDPVDCGTELCVGVPCGAIPPDAQLGPNSCHCDAEGHCMSSGYTFCDVSPRCAGQPCGADCSVENSDIPLTCNPQGFCVAASVSCEV